MAEAAETNSTNYPVELVQQHEAARRALAQIEQRFRGAPDSVELLFERACYLEATGGDALAAYLVVLERAPAHLGALLNLGNLYFAARHMATARELYERAAVSHPADAASRTNLGNLLIRTGQTAAAREQFEWALLVDPDNRAAHAGLSLVLEELGEPERAARHRAKAFSSRPVAVAAYRGEKPPIPVLELISTTGGNIRTDEFVSDRVFGRIRVTPEFYEAGTALPPHRLVINAIGDADGAKPALAGAMRLLRDTSAPVINAPAAVLATGRCAIAERLAGLGDVRTAKTARLPRELLAGAGAASLLEGQGFRFPLLLRTPGFHGGAHFARVETPGDLAGTVGPLPGDELLVIEYLDGRGADGCFRKYRVMTVGSELYPLHLAISGNWKVHYYTADMADSEEHRREDEGFLEDMAAVLGARAMAALEAIQATLGLDYGGIDFGLSRAGELLLFEANATMTVVTPEADPRWDYRRGPVRRILEAVETMLVERARPVPPLRRS